MHFGGFILCCTFQLHCKICFQCFQERFECVTVQVLDNTIIVEDCQLVCWEAYSHIIVVFLFTCIVWILRSLLCTNQSSGCRTVVTIGNIKRIHLGKFCCNNSLVSLISNYPKFVTKTINWRDKIILWRLCRIFCNQLCQRLTFTISQEDGFDICIRTTYVLHTVFFLISASQFMLFDDLIHIVFDVRTKDKTILCLAIHRLCIEIIIFLLILHQPTLLLEILKLLCSTFVNTWVVLARTYGEIDFRFNNMIQGLFVISCLCSCLFRTQNVVRSTFHLLNQRHGRANTTKRFYFWHIYICFYFGKSAKD